MKSDTLHELYELFLLHPHISTDSRRIEPGSIFFALHGEHFDGNRYAAAALESGAVAVVVDDPKVIPLVEEAPCSSGCDCGHGSPHEAECTCEECTEEESRRDGRYILVPDTLEALQELAAYHRSELGVMILAITGSNGKTTTKELVGRTLSQKYETTVTQGNLNNHIGVPLTLLSMTPETDFAVVEMGASHRHEIEKLCAIARPDFGLITNIGRSHLEGFGGPEGVRKGKGELLDYLAANSGTAFYLSDDAVLSEMVAERPNLYAIPYNASGLTRDDDGEMIGVRWEGLTIHSKLVGDYNLNNIAAALAMAAYFAVAPEGAAAAIAGYTPDNNRSQKQVTAHNTLILDAYNANPSSMQAALDNFLCEADPRPKAVVLGDMGELGDLTDQAHFNAGALAAMLGIDFVIAIGSKAARIADGAAMSGGDVVHFATKEEALPTVREQLRPNTSMLIKASHSMRFERLTEDLRKYYD